MANILLREFGMHDYILKYIVINNYLLNLTKNTINTQQRDNKYTH